MVSKTEDPDGGGGIRDTRGRRGKVLAAAFMHEAGWGGGMFAAC